MRGLKDDENDSNHSTADEVAVIKQAVDHLLECELTEENGWSQEDISSLEKVSEQPFEIRFK